ncbi:ThuA domain-containing protein [Christiangramia sp. SM2212]|uniref:ThuA domain-containing protein n=1 Tax=Christiangramia sediminicola TaxID=3073267 RepID=A0ABU1ETZ5_9FLAO|nr:ThuA domain-containing protein [Christiangramia sp. SM2212]MDR5591444.1 ThuA domain-containing protein [Christiangramia sp. SM2212]
MMQKLLPVFLIFAGFLMKAQEKQVLIFSKTEDFRHSSIEAGIQALQSLGNENGFRTVTSQDSRYFTENDLSKLNLIIFLNTSGDIFNLDEQNAFQAYMDNGGNFFGIHAAADTELNWFWYTDLVGAKFNGHPAIQEASIIIENRNHQTLKNFQEETWVRTDEWYNYKDISEGLNVLMSLDESSYKGGENGEFHPIAWYHNYRGGGISIYTGGGHTSESYSEPEFLDHLERSIKFAMSN